MTPNVQLEVERKYEVPAGVQPDWSSVDGLRVSAEPAPRQLQTVYFDTPNRRLAAFGVVLRRRHGGPDAGWHIKYRDAQGKQEIHVPLLKTSDRLPAQMKQYIAGLLADEDIAPLVMVENTRQVSNVYHPTWGHVAEICMDDVTATDSHANVQRLWTECEIELVNASGADEHAVFDQIESVVFAAGLTRSDSAAKVARALGADDHMANVRVTDLDGNPVKVTQKKTGKKSSKKNKKPTDISSSQQLKKVVALCVHELLYADFLLRIGDAKGIHATRMAARRIIAIIEGLGPDFAGKAHVELMQRLAALSERFSAARDAEVVAELLPQRLEQIHEQVSAASVAALTDLAQSARESTRSAAVRYVNSREHLTLLMDIEQWAHSFALKAKASQASSKQLATRAVKRWSYAVANAERVVAANPTGMDAIARAEQNLKTPAPHTKMSAAVDTVHVHRKALRNLRYGLDAFAYVDGMVAKKPWRGVLKGSSALQTELSQMMDSAVMDDWFAYAGRSVHRNGGDRYLVGLLHGYERARIHNYQRRAPELVRTLRKQVSPQG